VKSRAQNRRAQNRRAANSIETKGGDEGAGVCAPDDFELMPRRE
jgi:hypothetical protein